MQAAQFFGPVFDLNWPANLKPKMKAKKKLRKRIKRKLSAALPATAKELKGYGVVWGINKSPLHIEVSHLTHWRTKAGDVVSFRDMEINHLMNARALVIRRLARMREVDAAMSREISLRLLAAQEDNGKYPDARDLWDAYGGNSE